MTSPKFSVSLIDQSGLSATGRLDYASITRILAAIEARLAPLEGQKTSMDEAIEALRQVGLDRINSVLIPSMQWILQVQELGFLIAESGSPATLNEGDILTLTIDGEASRSLFTPAPFSALTRRANADDLAIVRTISFDKVSGQYRCQVVTSSGDPGPHSDWVIGALAGSTAASSILLDRTIAARNAASASAGVASGFSTAAAGSASAAAASREAAATLAGNASASAALAAQWAERAPGDPVAAGKYSARHHAEAARQHAEAAQTFDPATYYSRAATDALLDGYYGRDAADLRFRAAALPGEIVQSAVPLPSPQWLECDGSALLQSAWPELYAAIGGAWDDYDPAPIAVLPQAALAGTINQVVDQGGMLIAITNIAGEAARSNYQYSADGAAWAAGAFGLPQIGAIVHDGVAGRYVMLPLQISDVAASRAVRGAASLAGPWAQTGTLPSPAAGVTPAMSGYSTLISGAQIIARYSDASRYSLNGGTTWSQLTGTLADATWLPMPGGWLAARIVGSSIEIWRGATVTTMALVATLTNLGLTLSIPFLIRAPGGRIAMQKSVSNTRDNRLLLSDDDGSTWSQLLSDAFVSTVPAGSGSSLVQINPGTMMALVMRRSDDFERTRPSRLGNAGIQYASARVAVTFGSGIFHRMIDKSTEFNLPYLPDGALRSYVRTGKQ